MARASRPIHFSATVEGEQAGKFSRLKVCPHGFKQIYQGAAK
jgi:hypothetical protein